MQLKKLLKTIEEILPAQTAMDGDRIGLQIQGGNDNVSGVLVTLEVNNEVIKKALELKANCIISFHPLIYSPLITISESNRVGFLVSELIRNSISLIVVHTNFDAFERGTSYILAEKLGLIIDSIILPDSVYENTGMGILARTEEPMKPEDLLSRVSNLCKSPLRYCKGKTGSLISRIAIVGGSGTSFLSDVKHLDVDAFITADITYHKFHEADGKMMLIDPGHYEMEQFVPEALANLLNENFKEKDFEIYTSSINTNPVFYYPSDINYHSLQTEYLFDKNY